MQGRTTSILRSSKTLIKFIFAVLLCFNCLFLQTGCKEGAADLAPGRAIKDFKLKNLEGTEVDLYSILKVEGSSKSPKTLLAFMASWCQSCKSEIPYLNKIHHNFMQQKSGQVIAVALDDTLEDLKKLKERESIDFQIYYDNQSKSRKYFRLTGFPEYLVLDSSFAPKLIDFGSGSMSVKLVGPQDWDALMPQIAGYQ